MLSGLSFKFTLKGYTMMKSKEEKFTQYFDSDTDEIFIQMK